MAAFFIIIAFFINCGWSSDMDIFEFMAEYDKNLKELNDLKQLEKDGNGSRVIRFGIASTRYLSYVQKTRDTAGRLIHLQQSDRDKQRITIQEFSKQLSDEKDKNDDLQKSLDEMVDKAKQLEKNYGIEKEHVNKEIESTREDNEELKRNLDLKCAELQNQSLVIQEKECIIKAAREENLKLKKESQQKNATLQEKEAIIEAVREEIEKLSNESKTFVEKESIKDDEKLFTMEHNNIKMVVPKKAWFIAVGCLVLLLLILIVTVIILLVRLRGRKDQIHHVDSDPSSHTREIEPKPEDANVKKVLKSFVSINARSFDHWKSTHATSGKVKVEESNLSDSDEDLFTMATNNEGTKGTTKTIV